MGGKTRMLFLSIPGMRARWILSGRVMVRWSEKEVVAEAERR